MRNSFQQCGIYFHFCRGHCFWKRKEKWKKEKKERLEYEKKKTINEIELEEIDRKKEEQAVEERRT